MPAVVQAEKEATLSMLSDLGEQLVADIAHSRKLTAEKVCVLRAFWGVHWASHGVCTAHRRKLTAEKVGESLQRSQRLPLGHVRDMHGQAAV